MNRLVIGGDGAGLVGTGRLSIGESSGEGGQGPEVAMPREGGGVAACELSEVPVLSLGPNRDRRSSKVGAMGGRNGEGDTARAGGKGWRGAFCVCGNSEYFGAGLVVLKAVLGRRGQESSASLDERGASRTSWS